MYLRLLVVNNSRMHPMTGESGTRRVQSQLGKVTVMLSLLFFFFFFLSVDTSRWKKSRLWKLCIYVVYVDTVRQPTNVISCDVLIANKPIEVNGTCVSVVG